MAAQGSGARVSACRGEGAGWRIFSISSILAGAAEAAVVGGRGGHYREGAPRCEIAEGERCEIAARARARAGCRAEAW
jgi:hypothetical protein